MMLSTRVSQLAARSSAPISCILNRSIGSDAKSGASKHGGKSGDKLDDKRDNPEKKAHGVGKSDRPLYARDQEAEPKRVTKMKLISDTYGKANIAVRSIDNITVDALATMLNTDYPLNFEAHEFRAELLKQFSMQTTEAIITNYNFVASSIYNNYEFVGGQLNSSLRLVYESHGLNAMLWLFSRFRSYCNTAHWSRVMNLSNSSVRYDIMLALFEHSMKLDVPLDNITMSIVVRAYSRMGNFDESLRFMARMRSKGFPPDLSTYGLLIELLSKSNSHESMNYIKALHAHCQQLHDHPDFELSRRNLIDMSVTLGRLGMIYPATQALLQFGHTEDGHINTFLISFVMKATIMSQDRANSIAWMRALESMTGFSPTSSCFSLITNSFVYDKDPYLMGAWTKVARHMLIPSTSAWVHYKSWLKCKAELDETTANATEGSRPAVTLVNRPSTPNFAQKEHTRDFCRFSGCFRTDSLRAPENVSRETIALTKFGQAEMINIPKMFSSNKKPHQLAHSYIRNFMSSRNTSTLHSNEVFEAMFFKGLLKSGLFSDALEAMSKSLSITTRRMLDVLYHFNEFNSKKVGYYTFPVLHPKLSGEESTFGYTQHKKLNPKSYDFMTPQCLPIPASAPEARLLFGGDYTSPTPLITTLMSMFKPRSNDLLSRDMVHVHTLLAMGAGNRVIYHPPAQYNQPKVELTAGEALARHVWLHLGFVMRDNPKALYRLFDRILDVYAKLGLVDEAKYFHDLAISWKQDHCSLYTWDAIATINSYRNATHKEHCAEAVAAVAGTPKAEPTLSTFYKSFDRNDDVAKVIKAHELPPQAHEAILRIYMNVKKAPGVTSSTELRFARDVVKTLADIGDVQGVLMWSGIAEKSYTALCTIEQATTPTFPYSIINPIVMNQLKFVSGQFPTEHIMPDGVVVANTLGDVFSNCSATIKRQLAFPLYQKTTVTCNSFNLQIHLALFDACRKNPTMVTETFYMFGRTAAILEGLMMDRVKGRVTDLNIHPNEGLSPEDTVDADTLMDVGDLTQIILPGELYARMFEFMAEADPNVMALNKPLVKWAQKCRLALLDTWANTDSKPRTNITAPGLGNDAPSVIAKKTTELAPSFAFHHNCNVITCTSRLRDAIVYFHAKFPERNDSAQGMIAVHSKYTLAMLPSLHSMVSAHSMIQDELVNAFRLQLNNSNQDLITRLEDVPEDASLTIGDKNLNSLMVEMSETDDPNLWTARSLASICVPVTSSVPLDASINVEKLGHEMYNVDWSANKITTTVSLDSHVPWHSAVLIMKQQLDVARQSDGCRRPNAMTSSLALGMKKVTHNTTTETPLERGTVFLDHLLKYNPDNGCNYAYIKYLTKIMGSKYSHGPKASYFSVPRFDFSVIGDEGQTVHGFGFAEFEQQFYDNVFESLGNGKSDSSAATPGLYADRMLKKDELELMNNILGEIKFRRDRRIC